MIVVVYEPDATLVSARGTRMAETDRAAAI